MLLLLILTWTVGIPVIVLAIAGVFAWCRERRARRAPAGLTGGAQVYQFIPPSRIF
jgi:hypothetical protein